MMSFGNADNMHSASNNPRRVWQTDRRTNTQNYESQDRPPLDAHAVTKLWQSTFQLYFPAAGTRAKCVNFMNNCMYDIR